MADIQPVVPGPLPLVTQTGVARTPEGRVVLQCQTPQGSSFFFLSPEHAREVARQLVEQAGKAAIEIAQVMPEQNGHGPPMLKGLNGQ
jgi:hypothetical protein